MVQEKMYEFTVLYATYASSDTIFHKIDFRFENSTNKHIFFLAFLPRRRQTISRSTHLPPVLQAVLFLDQTSTLVLLCWNLDILGVRLYQVRIFESDGETWSEETQLVDSGRLWRANPQEFPGTNLYEFSTWSPAVTLWADVLGFTCYLVATLWAKKSHIDCSYKLQRFSSRSAHPAWHKIGNTGFSLLFVNFNLCSRT